MKRSPLKRKTSLRSSTGLKARSGKKRAKGIKCMGMIFKSGCEWEEGYDFQFFRRDGRIIAHNPRLYKRLLSLMVRRQGGLCCLCGRPMNGDATFEHEVPRGMGGGRRDDRIYCRENGRLRRLNGASHALCNCLRGSKRTPLIQPKYCNHGLGHAEAYAGTGPTTDFYRSHGCIANQE